MNESQKMGRFFDLINPTLIRRYIITTKNRISEIGSLKGPCKYGSTRRIISIKFIDGFRHKKETCTYDHNKILTHKTCESLLTFQRSIYEKYEGNILKLRYSYRDSIYNKDGFYKSYHNNGKIREIGDYEQTRKIGKFTLYTKRGWIIKETFFSNNRFLYYLIYNENGGVVKKRVNPQNYDVYQLSYHKTNFKDCLEIIKHLLV